jgi:predicted membrane protein DUF2231
MALADDLWTVNGIPAHPLLVHAVVVLLPLAAVGAIALAVRPAWRRKYSWPVLGLTVVGVGSVPLAQKAGEQLYDKLSGLDNPLIGKHADLGNDLLPFALGFLVAVVLLVVAGRLADRETTATAESQEVPKTWRRIAIVMSVLVICAGVASTVQVVRIGDSGATAVWDGVGVS